MTKASKKFSLRKFLQISLLTFAVFSNVSLVFADAASDAADAAAKAADTAATSAKDNLKTVAANPNSTNADITKATEAADAAAAAATAADAAALNAGADAAAASNAADAAKKLQDAANAADKNRAAYSSFDLGNLSANGQGFTYFSANSAVVASSNPLASFILQIINFITIIAGSLSFLAVVIGGFMIMSSAGNENQVTKGKDILMHALIGLVITLTAYFVIAFVQSLLFETAK